MLQLHGIVSDRYCTSNNESQYKYTFLFVRQACSRMCNSTTLLLQNILISEYYAQWKSVVWPLWKGVEQTEQGSHLVASSWLSYFLYCAFVKNLQQNKLLSRIVFGNVLIHGCRRILSAPRAVAVAEDAELAWGVGAHLHCLLPAFE